MSAEFIVTWWALSRAFGLGFGAGFLAMFGLHWFIVRASKTPPGKNSPC